MRMQPFPRRGPQWYRTDIEVDGVDYSVIVHYQNCPPEPDVGFEGGIDIECVEITSKLANAENGNDLQGRLSEEQLNELAIEINEAEQSAWEAFAEQPKD